MRTNKKLPDWVIGLVVTMVFLFVTLTGMFDFTGPIEIKTFDLRARMTASRDRNPDIELVVISENDISELGAFPWPRDVLGRCIDNIAQAGAKVIALNMALSKPQESPGFIAVRRLHSSYEMSGLAQQGPGLIFYKELSKAMTDLDNDKKLYSAFEKAGNIVLPVWFDTRSSARDMEVPDFVSRYAFERIDGRDKSGARYGLRWFSKLGPLLPSLADVAAGIGHMNIFEDKDGCVRNQDHVIGYLKGIYFPSFPLAIVRVFKDIKNRDMAVVLGEGIKLKISPSSIVKVPVVYSQMSTPIKWSAGPAVAFHQTPFVKVLKNRVETGMFKDKIVIIGTTAPGIGVRFATPISGNLPDTEVVANSVANILYGNFISRPGWLSVLEPAILVLFGFFIAFILPRLNAGPGAYITLGLIITSGSIGTALLFYSNIWLSIAPSILLLIVGYFLLFSNWFLSGGMSKKKALVEASKMDTSAGFSSNAQSAFNRLLEEFRRLPLEEEKVKDLLFRLGLGYEQNQQFSKAIATYELLMEQGGNFRDLDERVRRLKRTGASFDPGSFEGRRDDDLKDTIVHMDTFPALEQYELMQELERGKTGFVYKAQDIKTKQTVAIKAVNLKELGEGIVTEVKKRFFQGIESVGLLTHPNIVTIYDFGEDKGFAYVVMEYIEGTDLRHYIRPGHLLPLRETLDIVACVAETLDYVHRKGIIHGNIEPANVMWTKETGDVKIIGFGITRVMPSSMYKKHTGPDFPYYVSPEQLSGKKTDGRSDVFSAGVLLFEMVTGHKPFTGEDISDLMLSIARGKHPSAKALRQKVPRVVEKIIDRALEKELNKRYQRAGQMAEHLRKVIGKIDEILAQR